MDEPRKERFEVIQPGISISSKNSTTGTLGMIVFDKRDNYAPCMLSNWHVLAARKPKKLGLTLRKGAVTYQPGRGIAGRVNANIVGNLVRSNRKWDCAISKIKNRDFKREMYETNVIITKTRVPEVGDIVEKSGVTTGGTRAKVKSVGSKWVSFEPVGDDMSVEISQGGDSGSIWYDPETLEGIALHSTGDDPNTPNSESASGLLLAKVMEKLDISLTPKP